MNVTDSGNELIFFVELGGLAVRRPDDQEPAIERVLAEKVTRKRNKEFLDFHGEHSEED